MSSVTLGALNGLLESIDPYASYLNAEQQGIPEEFRQLPRISEWCWLKSTAT